MVHLHNGILHNRKKELLPFMTALMELESIMLSQAVKDRQIPYDLTCKRNLMNKTNKQNGIRSRETRNRLTVTRGEDRGG